jgi:ligand-binding SRPBCC domain-containing protein
MATELIVTARYDEDADRLFEKASSFADMIDVTRRISTYDGLPAQPMEQGQTYRTDVKVFGLLKFRDYAIHIDTLCKTRRRMQSTETVDQVRSWKHTLDVYPEAGGTIWMDRVCIDAGWRTPVIARYARFMYRHRHTQRGAVSVAVRMMPVPRASAPDPAAFEARDLP